jgi:immunity protein, SdpI family
MRSRSFGYWLTAAAAVVSLWAYGRLPPRVPIHFGLAGQPNGYGPKLLAVLLVPLMMLGLRGLLAVLPRIDPKRENYDKFHDTYWLIANSILSFMAVVHTAVLAFALGAPVRVDRVVTAGLGVLLVIVGSYLGRVEPNWFVGIRTPWTLSSEDVWRRTHRVGGWILVIGGLLSVATFFVPAATAFPVFVATIVLVALVPAVISYLLWKREGH